MAYSRWNENSVWYTFWTASFSPNPEYKLPTKKLKDNQFFEICDYPSYYVSYGELKAKGIKKVVSEIEDFYKDKKETKFSDYTVLRWYLIQFMTDVEEHFELKNFFYYEWYLPTRNILFFKYRKIKKLVSGKK